jgi:hypothetical protein
MNLLENLFASGNMSMTEILPICHVEDHYFVLDSGKIVDILQINTKTHFADETTVKEDINCLQSFLKTYEGDIKIIALNFPVNTISQQVFFRRIIKTTENAAFKEVLKTKLCKLEELQSTPYYTVREFYIMFWANSREHYYNQLSRIKSYLNAANFVSELDTKKKLQVMEKLTNKSQHIFMGASADEKR